MSQKQENWSNVLKQALTHGLAALGGAIAGTIATLYGTLTDISYLEYVREKSGSIPELYRNLFEVSSKCSQYESCFESLGMAIDPVTGGIYYLDANSPCKDTLDLQSPNLNFLEIPDDISQSRFNWIASKIQKIEDLGIGYLKIDPLLSRQKEVEVVYLKIDLMNHECSILNFPKADNESSIY